MSRWFTGVLPASGTHAVFLWNDDAKAMRTLGSHVEVLNDAELTGDVLRGPLAVNLPPEFAGWVLVLQCRRQPRLADAVIAGEHGEAAKRSGNADGREAGVAGGGEGAAVVHGGADRDASRHFVVEQPADFLPQHGGE